jgi:phosphoglycolate phosphatase-like HAD superfamily hydrolase
VIEGCAAPLFSGITAVLVDVDGTVLDSNDAHARSWVAAFSGAGLVVPYDEVRSLIGKGGDKLLAETVGIDAESEQGKRLAEARRAHFEAKYLGTLRPTAGIRDLLLHFHRHDIEVVVATAAGGDEVNALLGQAGVRDLVDAICTSADAEATKPDPDIVHAALEKAGATADQAIMIGDTPYDVDAAAKAGVKAIALRCGGWWTDDDLAGAVAIHDDPAALRKSLLSA